jgi:hypothetical protein
VRSMPSPTDDARQCCRRVRLIVWCKECQHQVEPDPAEIAARHGAETPVPDWRERLVCSKCGSRQVDMVASGVKSSGGDPKILLSARPDHDRRRVSNGREA